MSDPSAVLDTWLRVGNIALVLIGIGGVLVKMSALATKLEMVGTRTTTEISELKTNVAKLQEVIVAQALSDRDISDLRRQLDRVSEEVKDLRHGRGFVQRSVDGEWPKT